TAVLWVVGISEAGYREHLGVWLGASESLESWSRVFSDLVQRALEGVTYVVCDEHVGLLPALRRYSPEAEHQRCTVHYLSNALSKTSSKALEAELKSALKDVWAAPGLKEAKARLARLVDSLRERHPSLADWLEEETAEETLGFFSLPDPAHRRRPASTNGIEHDHAEIRRRTRVGASFPTAARLLRLATALAAERNEQWLERRYLNMQAPVTIDQPVRQIAWPHSPEEKLQKKLHLTAARRGRHDGSAPRAEKNRRAEPRATPLAGFGGARSCPDFDANPTTTPTRTGTPPPSSRRSSSPSGDRSSRSSTGTGRAPRTAPGGRSARASGPRCAGRSHGR